MNNFDDGELLKGEICEQYIVCSKPRCRCQHGELHGPYYYRVWREGERIQKKYVKKHQLEAVRAGCAAYKVAKENLRTRNEQRVQLTRSLKHAFRTTKRIRTTASVTQPGTLFAAAA